MTLLLKKITLYNASYISLIYVHTCVDKYLSYLHAFLPTLYNVYMYVRMYVLCIRMLKFHKSLLLTL